MCIMNKRLRSSAIKVRQEISCGIPFLSCIVLQYTCDETLSEYGTREGVGVGSVYVLPKLLVL